MGMRSQLAASVPCEIHLRIKPTVCTKMAALQRDFIKGIIEIGIPQQCPFTVEASKKKIVTRTLEGGGGSIGPPFYFRHNSSD